MDLELMGRVAFVTGSSSGIGRAIALAFGREGARVVVTYRKNEAEAENTAQSVREVGGEALVVPFDLTDRTSIAHTVETVLAHWSTIDVLVNNANIREAHGSPGRWPLFEEVPEETWQRFVSGSLGGVYRTLQAVVPTMRAQQWGRIVTISSTQAEDGFPGAAYYAAAKAGLHGINATLVKELGPVGVLSNIVMPGFTMTEKARSWMPEERIAQMVQQTSTRRLATPEDIARLVVFLGSPANTNINGQEIRVDGGQ